MNGMEMVLLSEDDERVSGCPYKSDKPLDKNITNSPLLYLSVTGRMKDALLNVIKLGGKIEQDMHPIGEYGFRAVIIDSEGNRIALHSR